MLFDCLSPDQEASDQMTYLLGQHSPALNTIIKLTFKC